MAVTNLWIETEGRCMPAEQICHPDADINYKRSVNRIIAEIGTEEVAKAQKKATDDAKKRRSWGR